MKRIFPWLVFMLIFSAVSILLSLWVGLVWRNSLFIVLVSLPVAYFIFKKNPFEISVPLTIYVLGFLGLLMAAYPLLLIHPYYPASADGAATTASIVIGTAIPKTYEPYSSLSYRYEIGFPLFAKIMMDFAPSVPPYLISWLLGALAIFLQIIFVYVLAKLYFKSDSCGKWAALLFVGSKVAFQSMYAGEYPWLLGTVFFLAAVACFLNRNKLAYLFLPVVFIVHPGPAFNLILFLAVFFIFFREQTSRLLPAVLSLAGAIPSFFITYIPAIWNSASGGLHSVALSQESILRSLLIVPPWIGIVPFTAAVFGIVWSVRQRTIGREKLILIGVLGLSVLLNIGFGLGGSVLGAKVIELAVLASVMLGGSFLAEIRIDKTGYSTAAKALIVILCLFFFFSSKTLSHYRSGSKITPEEAEFSLRFRELEPKLARTLFLSNNWGKMAEISGKIPFDVNSGWFLPYSRLLIQNDPGAGQFYSDSEKRREIIDKNCIHCIYELGVEYVVVDERFFNQKLDASLIYSGGYFDLYKLP